MLNGVQTQTEAQELSACYPHFSYCT